VERLTRGVMNFLDRFSQLPEDNNNSNIEKKPASSYQVSPISVCSLVYKFAEKYQL
jgi:hypothetical protein